MIDEEKLYRLVGVAVREARVRAGLKQDEVADKLGLTRTSISNFERGQQRVQLQTLYELAALTNVGINQLMPNVRDVLAEHDRETEALFQVLRSGSLEEPKT